MDPAVDPPAEGQPPDQEELAGLFNRLNFIRGTINNFDTQMQQFPAPMKSNNTTSENDPCSQNITHIVDNISHFSNENTHDDYSVFQEWRDNKKHSRENSPFQSEALSRESNETEQEIPKFHLWGRPPDFNADKDSPPQHLEKLREYLNVNQVKSEKYKIALAKRGLERKHKKELSRFSRFIRTYDDFEMGFLEEFWSTRSKLKQRDRLFNEKFQARISDESIYDFYLRTLQRVTIYYPGIDFEEFKFKISNQFPSEIRIFLQNPKIENFCALDNFMKSISEWHPSNFSASSSPQVGFKDRQPALTNKEYNYKYCKSDGKISQKHYQRQKNFKNDTPNGKRYKGNLSRGINKKFLSQSAIKRKRRWQNKN
jgi:hypothetical protein